MDWQPIDTAPRDGTRVLVAYDNEVGVAHFDPARIAGHEWVDVHGSGGGSHLITHWMPLPDLPHLKTPSPTAE